MPSRLQWPSRRIRLATLSVMTESGCHHTWTDEGWSLSVTCYRRPVRLVRHRLVTITAFTRRAGDTITIRQGLARTKLHSSAARRDNRVRPTVYTNIEAGTGGTTAHLGSVYVPPRRGPGCNAATTVTMDECY